MSSGPAASGAPPVAGAALLELVAIMDRLRTQCPWDKKQTHQSLAPYLVEETYEALEAIGQGDLASLREELGDVLLQVLFHSRIAAERTDGTGFTIDDVAAGIAAKLVRRHPHVFGTTEVAGAEDVIQNWDTIKAAERAAGRAAAGRDGAGAGGRASALEGIPLAQPALPLASQLLSRATRAGAPDELADLAPTDVASSGPAGAEAAGAEAAGADAAGADAAGAEAAGPARTQVSALGAELFALVAGAREAGLAPELELRQAARLYRDRVLAWERGGARA